jgi:hypothetical protein
MRRKRSDTGVRRIYNPVSDSTYSMRLRSECKPTDKQIIINALKFIENFEASGEEYIWIEGLKQVLGGKP